MGGWGEGYAKNQNMQFMSNTAFSKTCHLCSNYRKHARVKNANKIANSLHMILSHIGAVYVPGN
jgi:hypothetical protein